MLNKELSYKIFRVAWIVFLVANVVEFNAPADIDLIPFLHISEIPFIKYILVIGFALLIIPAREYLSIFSKKNQLFILALLFLLLGTAIISSYYSSYPDTAFRVTGRISFYLMILIITLSAVSYFNNASNFIIKSFIYVSSFVIAGSLLDFFMPGFHQILVNHFDRPGIMHSYMKIGNEIVMRPMGFVTDANLAAFVVASGLMLLLLNSRSFNKIFRFSYYILGSFAFGMLTSRIALAMCVISVLVFFVLKAVKRKEIILFCIVFIIFQAVTPQTYSRIVSLFDKEKMEEELTVGRPVIWSSAYRLFTEHPEIGAGPGVF
ncbi:MAG TPA: O-antigen ligase family protein, partial [Ignavibacteria bacterium]|nr:O-antigen ligase family protein [Ignavibacteria bacterium]